MAGIASATHRVGNGLGWNHSRLMQRGCSVAGITDQASYAAY
jgi:hypothetical protein